ncbi:MAG TPA: hypothetical protein VF587_02210 [Solirubrobacteraceae bacterium]
MLRTFALMRVVVGGQSWIAPRLSARMVGLDTERNPQAAYWTRLFGIRDVVLGVAALQTEGDARRRIIRLTAACDAADAAAAVLGRRAGYLSGTGALLSGGVAVGAGIVAVAAAASAE